MRKKIRIIEGFDGRTTLARAKVILPLSFTDTPNTIFGACLDGVKFIYSKSKTVHNSMT